MSSVGSRLIHGGRTGQHPNECGLFRSCLNDAAADPDMFHAEKQQGCMPERVLGALSEKAAAKAKLQTLFSQLLAQLEKHTKHCGRYISSAAHGKQPSQDGITSGLVSLFSLSSSLTCVMTFEEHGC